MEKYLITFHGNYINKEWKSITITSSWTTSCEFIANLIFKHLKRKADRIYNRKMILKPKDMSNVTMKDIGDYYAIYRDAPIGGTDQVVRDLELIVTKEETK